MCNNMSLPFLGPSFASFRPQYERYRLLVLVAGGIGVTPCISLLRHLNRLAREEHLTHCLDVGVRLVRQTRKGYYKSLVDFNRMNKLEQLCPFLVHFFKNGLALPMDFPTPRASSATKCTFCWHRWCTLFWLCPEKDAYRTILIGWSAFSFLVYSNSSVKVKHRFCPWVAPFLT